MRHLAPVALCLVFGHAAASTDPLRPRELVHPYPATGPVEVAGTVAGNKVLRTMQRYAVPAFTDVLALHVAHTLQGESDDRVQVVRRPRQNGNEAYATVRSAVADGRTLLLASSMPAAADAVRPVALVASMPYVVIAVAHSNFRNLGEAIGETRAGPRPQLMGSVGERSSAHRAIELLRLQHGVRIEPVAYNGGNAALQAVVSRQVSTALVPLPALLPFVAGGRIRALAIAAPQRHPSIPAVQTSAESGLANFEAIGSFSVFAPTRTPPSVIRHLDASLARGLLSGEARLLFADLGLTLEHRASGAYADKLTAD